VRVFGYWRRPSRSRRHCDLDTPSCLTDPLCGRHRYANEGKQRATDSGTDGSADSEPYADDDSDVVTNVGTEPQPCADGDTDGSSYAGRYHDAERYDRHIDIAFGPRSHGGGLHDGCSRSAKQRYQSPDFRL
jgi:hypothetical protein